MAPDLLFGVAFACQIATVSLYLPRRARRLVESQLTDGGPASETADHARRAVRRYVATANVLAGLGVLLLLLHAVVDPFDDVRKLLLGIGGYFLLQMAPFVIFNVPGQLASAGRDVSPTRSPRHAPASRRLFDSVSPSLLALAAVLASAYVGLALSRWQGTADTQLLKVGVFVLTNLLFAGTVVWSVYSGPPRSGTPDAVERQELAPTFVYLSIGISLYYFGKELIAAFDLQPLRPIMMSVWLQLLAVMAIQRLLGAPHPTPRT